jgi:hypothetical protein
VSKAKRYWIWIDGKAGLAPHELPEEIAKHGLVMGRSTGTWATALSYLRDYMKLGFVVRIYEVDE